jgi:hypothetical protein
VSQPREDERSILSDERQPGENLAEQSFHDEEQPDLDAITDIVVNRMQQNSPGQSMEDCLVPCAIKDCAEDTCCKMLSLGYLSTECMPKIIATTPQTEIGAKPQLLLEMSSNQTFEIVKPESVDNVVEQIVNCGHEVSVTRDDRQLGTGMSC